MANEIEITKDFPPSRERAVLLELLALSQALKKEGIDAVVCGGWVPFLKELTRDSHPSHSNQRSVDLASAGRGLVAVQNATPRPVCP